MITALNRVIQFNVGLNTDFITNRNTRTYFDPLETLSLGSTAGVGIGSTIRYTLGVVGGGSTDKFVLTQQVLIPGHGFRTGQKVLYNNGEGTSIQVYNGISTFNLANNSIVYVINDGRDLIGLSTNPVSIGNTVQVVGVGSTRTDYSSLDMDLEEFIVFLNKMLK